MHFILLWMWFLLLCMAVCCFPLCVGWLDECTGSRLLLCIYGCVFLYCVQMCVILLCVYGCDFNYCVCYFLSVCRLARRVRREQTPRSRNSCWDGSARVSQTSPHSRRPLEAPTWSALTRLTQSTLTIREYEEAIGGSYMISADQAHAVHPNYLWVWGGHRRLLHDQRWPGSRSPP